jgi:hypothetical protein
MTAGNERQAHALHFLLLRGGPQVYVLGENGNLWRSTRPCANMTADRRLDAISTVRLAEAVTND